MAGRQEAVSGGFGSVHMARREDTACACVQHQRARTSTRVARPRVSRLSTITTTSAPALALFSRAIKPECHSLTCDGVVGGGGGGAGGEAIVSDERYTKQPHAGAPAPTNEPHPPAGCRTSHPLLPTSAWQHQTATSSGHTRLPETPPPRRSQAVSAPRGCHPGQRSAPPSHAANTRRRMGG